MPLYEFKCEKCNYEFEELVANSDTSVLSCKKCGGQAVRIPSSFSSMIPGSDNESVDVKIGREAEKRWQMHHDQQEKRRSGIALEKMDLPKSGKVYTPVLNLGNKTDQKKRKEYSVALQEHRTEREKKGQPQFSEAGPF